MKASTFTKLKERFSADEIEDIVKGDKLEGYVITYFRRSQIGVHKHKEEFVFLCRLENGKPVFTTDLYKATIQEFDLEWMISDLPKVLNGFTFEVASQNVNEIKGRFQGVRVF